MTYLGLLYQDLIRTGQFRAGEKLPPVLPIVLYNGKHPWTAPTDVGDLIANVPGGLSRYRPNLRYLLIDEGAFAAEDLSVHRNAVAALFRLESCKNPEDVRAIVRELLDWLKAPEQTRLRRDFAVWFARTFLPGRAPGVEIPEFNDLQEVDAMLSETVIEWTRKWKEEGLAAGRKEGRKEGLEEGLEKGREEGREEVAQRMLAKGMDMATIAELTGLSIEELKTLEFSPDTVCEPAAVYTAPPRKKRAKRTG